MSKGPAARSLVVVSLVGGLLIAAAPSAHAAYYCFGKRATKVGTNGPDNLSGSPYKSDVIVALGGRDTIYTGGDWPSGNDPRDYICAGPGNDFAKGGPGADRINGGDGADELDGSFGHDIVDGNGGDDRVLDVDSEYESVSDTLRGSKGNDIVWGDYGADLLSGGKGNDDLYEGSCAHASSLYGGPGNDTLSAWQFSYEGTSCGGSSRPDRIFGDNGFDTADVNKNDVVTAVERVRRR